MDTRDTSSVLFVCLGNICRSPLAEGIFAHLLREEGIHGGIRVDSAGTGSWHVGEAADPRSREVAQRHGIRLESRARQVEPRDLREFDLVVAMDRSNLEELQAMQEEHGGTARLLLMREFDPEPEDGEVPDPYYGGSGGFDRVYEMLLRASRGLLEELRR
ncbi:MAG: low molecular weight phosphotyrosine protein phosphatase [Gemmatimonadota bacterium]|jgi:protein-tyrosine phosphatase